MRIWVNRVAFGDLRQALRLYKARGLDRETVLSYFSSEENRRVVLAEYVGLEPMTVREALAFENAEQRMAALASFSPEAVVMELNAETLDRQTLKKRQVRWDAQLRPSEVEYEDTYELLAFEVLNRYGNTRLFVVKCACPSTGRVYFLYVPYAVAQQKDAVAAVAWTFQVEGRPLSKADYLNLMYAET